MTTPYGTNEQVTLSLERYEELRASENMLKQAQERCVELVGLYTDIHNKIEELGIEILYEETDRPGIMNINLPESIETAFKTLKGHLEWT